MARQETGSFLLTPSHGLLEYNQKLNLSAWELALAYETARAGISEDKVMGMMKELYLIMRAGIKSGLRGTRFKDRLLGAQSAGYLKSMEEGKLVGGELIHKITLYVSALMEVKSSMGTIVAAPTAGSCGTFPGAILAVVDSLNLDEEHALKALLAGSLVGLFIATGLYLLCRDWGVPGRMRSRCRNGCSRYFMAAGCRCRRVYGGSFPGPAKFSGHDL